MCYCCLVCKAGQCGCFTFLILRQALFIKDNENATTQIYNLKKYFEEAIAQLVEYLPSMHEVCNLIPQHKPGLVGHACYPSTQEAKVGGSEVQVTLCYNASFRLPWDT